MLTATQNKPKARTQKRLYTFADYMTWDDGQRFRQCGIYGGKNDLIPVKIFDDKLQVSVAQVFAKLELIEKSSQ